MFCPKEEENPNIDILARRYIVVCALTLLQYVLRNIDYIAVTDEFLGNMDATYNVSF